MTEWRHYWRPGTGSLVTAVAFAWAGIGPNSLKVKKANQRDPEFLTLNPAAQVPVAVMPDGTILTESAAIILAIEEARPGSGLLPPVGTGARGTCLRWLMFLAVCGYPAALRYFYADRFTVDKGEDSLSAIREAASQDSDRIFRILAKEIKGPFLLGDTPSIVDVYAVMLADWHEPARDLPVFQALRQAVMAQPVIAQAWRSHEESPA